MQYEPKSWAEVTTNTSYPRLYPSSEDFNIQSAFTVACFKPPLIVKQRQEAGVVDNMEDFSKTQFEFKHGDFISFNNKQEWEEVLNGLLELGEEVYKGSPLWDTYQNCYFVCYLCDEGTDWFRSTKYHHGKRDVTEDFKSLLQAYRLYKQQEKALEQALSGDLQAFLRLINTNVKGSELKTLVGSLRDSQDDLTGSNYYLIDGEKHWNGKGDPEVGMKVLMKSVSVWGELEVLIVNISKDSLSGCTVYEGSFINQHKVVKTLSWNTQDWLVWRTEAACNKKLEIEKIESCLEELLMIVKDLK